MLTLLNGHGYSDAFVSIGNYPRSIALGQAVVALSGNSDGLITNPASTGFSTGTRLSGMYLNQFGMADLYSFHFNRSIGEKWQLGGSLLSLSVNGIQERPDLRSIYDLQTRRDTVRALTASGFDTFSSIESVVYINISRNFTRIVDLGWWATPFAMKIPVGINFKVFNKSLYDLTGYGIGMDIGTMTTFSVQDVVGGNWLGDLTLGVSLTNIPETQIYWDSDKTDQMDFVMIYGLGYKQVLVPNYLNAQFLIQNATNLDTPSIGLEAVFRDVFSLRVGKRYDQLQGGLGFNINIGRIITGIDYSFMSHPLGNSHRLGLNLNF